MLAPPGYAKIASTPSRSRQATRISLPFMAGPTSARLRVAGTLFAVLCSIPLSCSCHFWFVAGLSRGSNKKPTTVASRGFLSKFYSASTSPGGIAAYGNDYQNDLSNIHYHCPAYPTPPPPVKPAFCPFLPLFGLFMVSLLPGFLINFLRVSFAEGRHVAVPNFSPFDVRCSEFEVSFFSYQPGNTQTSLSFHD